jgi:putative transposase
LTLATRISRSSNFNAVRGQFVSPENNWQPDDFPAVTSEVFRTCKYRPDWPAKGFATRADAQAWVQSFANWYNGEHLNSAIRFVTPNMRHGGQDRAALQNRAILYANARAQNPERWSGKTRNWQPAGPVWLNPERETGAPEIRDAA